MYTSGQPKRWPDRPRRGRLQSAWAVLVWGALLAIALPLIGASTSSAMAAEPAPARPRLLVIGDSIILGTNGNIAANLTDWDVTFDADVSRMTDGGLDALRRHGTDYETVVVELGANDGETPSVFQPRVAALLDALRGVPHVLWLTVHEVRPYYPGANAIIAAEVARHPNATVADWNRAIRPGDVGGDGLHLTPQGATQMAAWVASEVRRVNAPPPTTTTTTSTSTSTTVAPTTSAATPPTGPPTTLGMTDRSLSVGETPGGRWGAPVLIAIAVVVLATVMIVLARRRQKGSARNA